MSFPEKVKEKALIACGRGCCLCHKIKGLKIELHHIVQKSEGGQDTFDNCIPLCFDCHADMRSYDHNHPKGIKYTKPELRTRRDDWYLIVKRDGVSERHSLTGADPVSARPQTVLRLEVGEQGEFFETMRGGSLWNFVRVLKVKVSNIDHARAMTGCKLQLLKIEPPEYEGPWILKDGFALSPGDHDYISFVSYGEPYDIKLSPHGDSFMVVLAVKNAPKPGAECEHFMTLRATALESPFCELICKVWIDENGRLRVQPIEGQDGAVNRDD